MVPLRARHGGVLECREASVDLCRLTQQPEGGVLCELVNEDEMGTTRMARRDDCRTFADEQNLNMISVEMLAAYRKSLYVL
ncbi:hypothetical protein JVU11DRAFT_11776 [Chiua virens]|nr:hypothetical protein JVU11DRAFT_11776 [Chiua virens]